MPIKTSEWIWHNGKLVPWADAKIHVLTHALHYGSSVFEGIRVYATHRGPAVFRLQAHTRRLLESAKIHRIDVPWSAGRDQCRLQGSREPQRTLEGRVHPAHHLPRLRRGWAGAAARPPGGDWRSPPGNGAPTSAPAPSRTASTCASLPGSGWRRTPSPLWPRRVATTCRARWSSLEAKQRGFAEGIALATDGTVSEGAGENIFLVRDGVIYTPPSTASILTGITRDSVMTLAREAGIEVRRAGQCRARCSTSRTRSS